MALGELWKRFIICLRYRIAPMVSVLFSLPLFNRGKVVYLIDTELLFFVFLYGGVFFSSEVALIPGVCLLVSVLISFLYYPILRVYLLLYFAMLTYTQNFFLRLVHSVPLGGNCVTIYSSTVFIKVIRSMMLVPSSSEPLGDYQGVSEPPD